MLIVGRMRAGSLWLLLLVLAVVTLAPGCGGSTSENAQVVESGQDRSTADEVAGSNPLLSWAESASRNAILDFVARVTDPASPDFVPEAERIATFDNDGTLWSEKPISPAALRERSLRRREVRRTHGQGAEHRRDHVRPR